jgi:hypothetical protein
VKRAVFSLLFCGLYLGIFSQENPNSQQIQTSLKVRQLMDKKASYNRLNNGEYDGFRIKIHFGVDKLKAREIKTKFSGKFPDILAYEDYAQPNFVITVGDFRSKLEATEVLKKIQPEFPNSFIVKSKIRPMKL